MVLVPCTVLPRRHHGGALPLICSSRNKVGVKIDGRLPGIHYCMTVSSRAAILVIYQYKGGTVGEMGRERVDNHSLDVA